MFNEAQLFAWIEAIGTLLSAIASTPSTPLSESTLNDLNLIGNVLQAVGNGYIPEDEELLTKVGTKIQALGNILAIESFFVQSDKIDNLLNFQGDLLQALGSAISINYDGDQSLNDALNNIGNFIQTIGNLLQALSITYQGNSEQAQELNVVGSWIQVIGAVLTALTTD